MKKICLTALTLAVFAALALSSFSATATGGAIDSARGWIQSARAALELVREAREAKNTPKPSAAPLPSAEPEPTPAPAPAPAAKEAAAQKETPADAASAVKQVTTPQGEPVALPYLIDVDKSANIVSVFTTDANGRYTVLARQMLCSSAKRETKPADGYYKLKAERHIWRNMGGCYTQYATRITGSFLFHSIPYRSRRADSIYWEKYNMLGSKASAGCIRLAVADAIWIYENAPEGTPVRIHRSGKLRPALVEALRHGVISEGDGWDPTDPHPNNPNYTPVKEAPLPQPLSQPTEKITFNKDIPKRAAKTE